MNGWEDDHEDAYGPQDEDEVRTAQEDAMWQEREQAEAEPPAPAVLEDETADLEYISDEDWYAELYRSVSMDMGTWR